MRLGVVGWGVLCMYMYKLYYNDSNNLVYNNNLPQWRLGLVKAMSIELEVRSAFFSVPSWLAWCICVQRGDIQDNQQNGTEPKFLTI